MSGQMLDELGAEGEGPRTARQQDEEKQTEIGLEVTEDFPSSLVDRISTPTQTQTPLSNSSRLEEFQEFSQAEIQFFQKIFREANVSEDGKLCVEELIGFLDSHDYVISRDEGSRIISEADEDADEKLSFLEFLGLCRKAKVRLAMSPSVTLLLGQREEEEEAFMIRHIFQAIFQTVGFMPSIKETVQFFENKIAELSRGLKGGESEFKLFTRKDCDQGSSSIDVQAVDSSSLMEMERSLLSKTFPERHSPFDYDLIVIGSGAGGQGVAREAASLGKKVLVVDFTLPSPLVKSWGWRFGPSCQNVGCVPKSLLAHASYLKETLGDFRATLPFGIFPATDPNKMDFSFSWPTLIDNIQSHVQTLNIQRQEEMERHGIEFVNSRCEFETCRKIRIKKEPEVSADEEQIISSEKIVIAVQSLYKFLDVEGAHGNCITVDDIWSMRSHPGRTLIIGGGGDAVECAGLLCALGVDVTIMSRSPVLKGWDRGIVTLLLETLHRRGLKQMFNYAPTVMRCNEPKIESAGDDKDNTVAGGNRAVVVEAKHVTSGEICEKEYDTVILAVGKKPATPILKLEKAEILVDDLTSKIWVDSEQMTTAEDVFSLDDDNAIASSFQSGVALAKHLFLCGSMSTGESFGLLQQSKLLLTPVQYAFVGLSEEGAISEHGEPNVLIYHAKFQPLHFQISNRRDTCYAKMLTLKSESERIIGLHYLGPCAGEILSGFSLALKLKAKKSDLESFSLSHGVFAEIFTRMTPTTESSKELLQLLTTL